MRNELSATDATRAAATGALPRNRQTTLWGLILTASPPRQRAFPSSNPMLPAVRARVGDRHHKRGCAPRHFRSDQRGHDDVAILGSCASRRDVTSDGRIRPTASPSTHPNAIWSRIELPDEFRSDQAAMTVLARLGALGASRACHGPHERLLTLRPRSASWTAWRPPASRSTTPWRPGPVPTATRSTDRPVLIGPTAGRAGHPTAGGIGTHRHAPRRSPPRSG